MRSIKEKIASKDLKDKYEADAVKLIFSGKILEDAKTLESYSINQDSFLVVVKQTPAKTSSAPTPAASTPSSSAAASNVQPPAPTAASSASAAPAQQQQQQPAQGSETSETSGASDSFLSAEAREKALQELTDMGFERTQAELALRASFYHVARAADYLLSVIEKCSNSCLNLMSFFFVFKGEIPTFSEAPASSQGGAPGQPSSAGSESSGGSRRTGPGGGNFNSHRTNESKKISFSWRFI